MTSARDSKRGTRAPCDPADRAYAIDWLTAAFGFRERAEHRHTDESGTVTYAELERDRALVMLATPNADYEGPRRHRETCMAAG